MYEYRVPLLRVIDGDTVEATIDLGFGVSIVRVLRLAGIDAPELRGSAREAGLESLHVLEQLTAGKQIVVRTERDRTGKYGRYLAVLLADGENVNERLVREGFAVRWPNHE